MKKLLNNLDWSFEPSEYEISMQSKDPFLLWDFDMKIRLNGSDRLFLTWN
jgi:hypothetical protein